MWTTALWNPYVIPIEKGMEGKRSKNVTPLYSVPYPTSHCCISWIYTRLTSVLTNQTIFLSKRTKHKCLIFPILSLIIKIVNEDATVLCTAEFQATFHLPLKSSRTRAQTLDLLSVEVTKNVK